MDVIQVTSGGATMSQHTPTTQTIDASEAHEQWSGLLGRVSRKEARVLVEDDGVAVAAIVSAEDLERLKFYEREREERFRIIDKNRDAFKDVSDDELEREVARAVADARQQLRDEAEHSV
jgi:PHD/YefM family antitoxin component YafN of YafNO toxin-antitoxin module